MENNRFFPALTGIRILCVSFIFVIHLNPFNSATSPFLYSISNQFFAFLDFFFVLSGFVICYKYDSIINFSKKNLYNYFVNRISRVFPILILLVSIAYLLKLKSADSNAPYLLKEYFLNISLVKGFSSKYHLTGIGPSWSLSVEELFYILSPFIFFFTRKKASNLMAIILLFYFIGAILTILFRNNDEGFFSSYDFTFYSTFFGRFFEFACGIHLAYFVKGNYRNSIFNRIGKNALLVGVLLFILTLLLLHFIATKNNTLHGVDSWEGILVNNLMAPIAITLIFFHLIYHNSILKKILSTKWMVSLGNCTYSFYLIHTTFILSLLSKYLSKNFFILYFSVLAISFAFNKVVEEPLAKFLRKKLSRS